MTAATEAGAGLARTWRSALVDVSRDIFVARGLVSLVEMACDGRDDLTGQAQAIAVAHEEIGARLELASARLDGLLAGALRQAGRDCADLGAPGPSPIRERFEEWLSLIHI